VSSLGLAAVLPASIVKHRIFAMDISDKSKKYRYLLTSKLSGALQLKAFDSVADERWNFGFRMFALDTLDDAA
jgi:hypothetical protein